MNITLGTIYSKQDFRSEIFQSLLENNDQFYPTPLINDGHDSNDINYIFDDFYLGLRYRLKVGKFTISPGFSAHSYNSKNDQYNVVNLDLVSDISYKKSFFKFTQVFFYVLVTLTLLNFIFFNYTPLNVFFVFIYDIFFQSECLL